MGLSLAEQGELELEREEARLIVAGLEPALAFDALYPADEPIPEPHEWWFWGRPEQIWRPGPETWTLMCAGRGYGKTISGAHATDYVGNHPELCGGRVAEGPDDRRAGAGTQIMIAGRTANEVNTTMVDGPVGILATCDPALRPEWNRSDKTLTWRTGVVGKLMSGDVPKSFRGEGSFGWGWFEELPHWARAVASWSAAQDALRVSSPGQHPRALITSTPLGTALMIALAFQLSRDGATIKAPPGTPADRVFQGLMVNPETRIVGGSSFDNRSNLSRVYLKRTIVKYAGTEDEDQEVRGLIRLKIPGALWDLDWIERCEPEQVPALDRVLVAVDPTGSDGERVKNSEDICECGIVALGLSRRLRKVWALRDRSLVAKPSRWADVVIDLAMEVEATEIVVEGNYGQGLLTLALDYAWSGRRSELRDRRQPRIILVDATVDKAKRARLAAPAWEARKVVHVGSPRLWTSLERQQTTYDPNRPHAQQQSDRMDAIVWGVLSLLGDGTDRMRVQPHTDAEQWKRIMDAARR